MSYDKEFIEYLKNLKAEDWKKKVTEAWSIKDLVAHMVGWEKNDSESIGTIWETKEPSWVEKTENFDAFNKKWVEHYKTYTAQQLIEEWEKYQNILHGEILKIGESKLRGMPKLFSWLFEPTSGRQAHYGHHLKQIKEVLQ